MEGRQQVTETSATSARSWTRNQILTQIVVKARLACSLPVPNKDETKAIVLAWAEVLEPIPTRLLDAAYLAAMRQHVLGPSSKGQSVGPFSVAEIVAAYDVLVKNGE